MSVTRGAALVVEDDRSWQMVLAELLQDAGLEVDIVDSLDGAVSALRVRAHRIAVVDLALGSGDVNNDDGLAVLSAVRAQDPACVAVLLTGYATVEIAVSALRDYGAHTCLRKDGFSRAGFRDLVEEALASAPALGVEAADEGPADRGARASRDEPNGTPPLGLALVVEDDASWRSILVELLTDAGYDVRACAGYGEALGCLRRERYGLAVVDLSLSGSFGATAGETSGGELEGRRLLVAAQEAQVPAVVVSGVSTPSEIERVYAETGALAYVEKQSFDRRAFRQAIEDARQRSAVMTELGRLTVREREVLALLAQGMTNKEIAQELVITTNTVKRHLKAVFEKLEVHTRSAAAGKAIAGAIVAVRPGDGKDESAAGVP